MLLLRTQQPSRTSFLRPPGNRKAARHPLDHNDRDIDAHRGDSNLTGGQRGLGRHQLRSAKRAALGRGSRCSWSGGAGAGRKLGRSYVDEMRTGRGASRMLAAKDRVGTALCLIPPCKEQSRNAKDQVCVTFSAPVFAQCENAAAFSIGFAVAKCENEPGKAYQLASNASSSGKWLVSALRNPCLSHFGEILCPYRCLSCRDSSFLGRRRSHGKHAHWTRTWN